MSVNRSSRKSIIILLIIGTIILSVGLIFIIIGPSIRIPVSCHDEDIEICNL